MLPLENFSSQENIEQTKKGDLLQQKTFDPVKLRLE
jgi:hypothetical protein